MSARDQFSFADPAGPEQGEPFLEGATQTPSHVSAVMFIDREDGFESMRFARHDALSDAVASLCKQGCTVTGTFALIHVGNVHRHGFTTALFASSDVPFYAAVEVDDGFASGSLGWSSSLQTLLEELQADSTSAQPNIAVSWRAQ